MTEASNKKKIAFFRGDRGACWLLRGSFPLYHLAKNHKEEYDIEASGQIDRRRLHEYSLVILQRQYNKEVFNVMLQMQKLGVKVVYETDDDLLNVPKWNPAYEVLGHKEVQDNIKFFLSKVDAVFTTTQPLAEMYSKYCPNVYILRNSIDFGVIHPKTNNVTKPVILWAGSNTHQEDIGIIRPAFERLAKDEDVIVKAWSYDFGIPNIRKVPFVHLEDYYTMMGELDACIGLAPLKPVSFNRGKSNLKWLEYGANNMATIASNFGPYAESIEHEKTGLLVSSINEWYDAIRYLIDNKEVRETLAKNAYDVVYNDYNISKNYTHWKQAIDLILGNK